MPTWRSSASVDPSTASPRSNAGSSDRSDGERNGAYEGGVAPPTSSGMARPAGGRSTWTPAAEKDLSSQATPLATETTRSTRWTLNHRLSTGGLHTLHGVNRLTASANDIGILLRER